MVVPCNKLVAVYLTLCLSLVLINSCMVYFQKWKEDKHLNFLSFGTRRSSTVSNYGNTPIIMRRSISSNGELAPCAVQSGAAQSNFGSLRGAPSGLAEQEAKYGSQFGSLRGLPSSKRLSKFDECEELEAGTRENRAGDGDRYSDTRSTDSWDTASLNVGVKSSGKGRKNSRLNNKKGIDDDRDNWRERNNFEANLPHAKNLEKVKQEPMNRSSESLVSGKKKTWWWFRRKKSLKDPTKEEPDVVNGQFMDQLSADDKALSDINLKKHHVDENLSSQEDIQRNRILLKGYSQHTVAGLNLSNRSSGGNPSVTSRASLAGSDIIISDSSKSFMQYDLPLSREGINKPGSNTTMADKVREGKSYEEQFETSLGSGSLDILSSQSSDNIFSEDAAKNNALEPFIRQRRCSGASNASSNKEKREAINFNVEESN